MGALVQARPFLNADEHAVARGKESSVEESEQFRRSAPGRHLILGDAPGPMCEVSAKHRKNDARAELAHAGRP